MTDEATVTAREIAQWMLDQFGEQRRRWLNQETAVAIIRHEFGPEWSYRNRAGHWVIAEPVLAEFRSLSEHSVIWDRGFRAWRLRTDRDSPRRPQG
jgi:hypothetical protein